MPRMRHALRMTMRCLLLIFVSIVGMAMLGSAAYVVATRGQGVYGNVIPELMFPAAVGAFVGLFSTPFVVIWLKDAHLGRSLLQIYGVSLLVTVLWCFVNPYKGGITAAGPALISVIIMSARCGNRYALPKPAQDRCEQCDYNLSGCTDPGCPECGWARSEQPAA